MAKKTEIILKKYVLEYYFTSFSGLGGFILSKKVVLRNCTCNIRGGKFRSGNKNNFNEKQDQIKAFTQAKTALQKARQIRVK